MTMNSLFTSARDVTVMPGNCRLGQIEFDDLSQNHCEFFQPANKSESDVSHKPKKARKAALITVRVSRLSKICISVEPLLTSV